MTEYACVRKGLSVSSVFAEIMPRILLSFSFVICGCWNGRRGRTESDICIRARELISIY